MYSSPVSSIRSMLEVGKYDKYFLRLLVIFSMTTEAWQLIKNKQFIADTIIYIEYLIYEAKFHLVLIQMMSNLSLDIVISPQMCYNTL